MKSNISRRQFMATAAAAAAGVGTANAAKKKSKSKCTKTKCANTTASNIPWSFDPLKKPGRVKFGLYSMTYNGIWYKGGPAMDTFEVMRFAKKQGWEGIEYETKRPQACPMDLNQDDRKRMRDMSAELEIPICAISPNNDITSHIPEHLEAQLCYVRECIKLASDVGSPMCKIFTGWQGVVVRDGLGDYNWTRNVPDPYPQWDAERWDTLRDSLIELSKCAEDYGILLVLQNHIPIVRNYKDVLRLIDEVDSPVFKACLDLPNERNATDDKWVTEMVEKAKDVLVHSHYGYIFKRDANGRVNITAKNSHFYDRFYAHAAFIDALVKIGFNGYVNYERCSPVLVNGERAGINNVIHHAELGLEHMKQLRADAEAKYGRNA